MKDRGWLEPIVERVVGQVLESHAAQLRQEIVERVTKEMAAVPQAGRAGAEGSADLARAVAEIQMGTSQREILRALLDTCGRYAARVALFVVKGGQASGWQARGFDKSEAIKDFAVDASSAAVRRAIQERVAVNAAEKEIDSKFVKEFGKPGNGEARVLPLVLKDKVAALVYADAGTDSDGTLDAGAVELLVLATSAWLEVNSLRKVSHKEPAAETSETPRSAAAEPAPAFNDPFAGHVPAYARAAAATAAAPVIETPQSGASSSAVESTAAPLSEEQETQRKAQRFARLLVDEIKLYNQAKVAEGRKNKDLYDRLKEAIEKSRATYQKRYGNTVAGSAKYFEDEIVRSLAEDDVSVLGANFRR